MRSSRASRSLLVAAAILLGVLLTGCGASAHPAGGTVTPETRAISVLGDRVRVSGGSFLALWARAGKPTVLEQFSRRTGAPLASLLRVPSNSAEVGRPYIGSRERVWLTEDYGPRYRKPALEGGDPAPDSCGSRIVVFNARTGALKRILSLPSALLIGEGSPSPNGKRVAIPAVGCARSFGERHQLLVNLHTGRRSTIGSDAIPCHTLLSAQWSSDGSKVLFPFGPSRLSKNSKKIRNGHYIEPGCRFSLPNDLAIVASRGATEIKASDLIKPQPGCTFESAVFDREGIAAMLACIAGRAHHRAGEGANFPDVYLLQFNHAHKIVRRFLLSYNGQQSEGDALAAGRHGNSLLATVHLRQVHGDGGTQRVYEYADGHVRPIRRYSEPEMISAAVPYP